jgi:hypothetical protein
MEYFSKFANILGYIYPKKTIETNVHNLNLLNKNNCVLLNKDDFDTNIDKLIKDEMFYKLIKDEIFYKKNQKKIIKFNENRPLIKKSKKIIFIRKSYEED